MTKLHRAAGLLAAALAGCGGPAPSLSPPAPHHGDLFRLTDREAVFEIVRQDLPGKPGQVRLLLYYLGTDFKPKSPAPTVATLKPMMSAVKPVMFKPTGEADPARAGELAGGPIDAQVDLSGELSATIEGKPVSVAVNMR